MQGMRQETKDTVAALRGSLADLTADDAQLGALQAIIGAQLDTLDALGNAIVAATSIIAVAPGDRRVVGFASDAIEAVHKALGAAELIDKALDVLLVPYQERYEEAAHSVKART